VRQALVLLQFAVLIALLIGTTVTYRQNELATREVLRQNTNPVVILPTGLGGCSDALMTQMRRAQGVVDAACTQLLPAWGAGARAPLTRRDHEQLLIAYVSVGFGFFELFGFELAAGRLFSPMLGTDQSPPDNVWTTPESLVINETAARALGFGDPRDAVGETMTFGHLFRQPATYTPAHDATIIGVMKDFQIGRVTEPIPPAAFFVDPAQFIVMTIKLDGRATPEALQEIDRVWDQFGGPAPTERFFLEDSVARVYYDLQQQSRLFAVFAGLAVLIAVLGLVGLAAHAAASRTKEIGIRKALGGGRWAISALLLWQFSVPVLLANLVAWPLAYWAMSVWLRGFVKRVELDAWMFIAAGAVTLVVAVAAVLLHTWRMSGTRPVAALRYE
jgi:putative ABC transport system permease protein